MKKTFLKLKFYLASIFTPNKLQRGKTPMEKEGYELSFYDDFDGTELDTTKWRDTFLSGLRVDAGFKNLYLSQDCVKVSDGSVKLLTKKSETDSVYDIGWIQNDKALSQTGGYFEIRCKLENKKGIFPAFWLLTETTWPPEIDIFEFFGNNKTLRNLSYSLNWGNGNRPKEENAGKVSNEQVWVKTLWDGWNVFGFEWTDTALRLYINGFLVDENTNPAAMTEFNSHKWYVIINNSVQRGGNGRTGFEPSTFEVDYLKVWKKNIKVSYE